MFGGGLQELYYENQPLEYDDDLGDVHWVSEDDEWFTEDEDRFAYI